MSSKVDVKGNVLSVNVDCTKTVKVENSKTGKTANVAAKIGSNFGGEKMQIGSKWFTVSVYVAETTAPTETTAKRI